MANPTAAEYQLKQETADAYRDQGYEVAIDQELDFMPGFRADLLARKGDQVRVIEIKSRSALVNAGVLDHLARAIEAQPGWSFELVLAAETETPEPPRGADPIDREHVHLRLDEAEQLLDEGHAESAFILACMAYEAKIRLLLGGAEKADSRLFSFRQMSEQASYLGVISAEERDKLTRLWDLRNAMIHGYHAPEFNEDSARELIDVVRGLDAAAA
ncbi:MAG: hypothetical protein OXH19_10560 [Chloroflexi bacterium]|nr:hypothetical protein [Chloroflexota bacterium]MCY3607351.1 hypothetical protein [Acidimicrobiaceae bacterium]MCY3588091.1 hypothetical protein [Chloroflexota bacterium]MDE2709059.1 hypothetical protein [Chloroflexota bacterium]MXY78535.1 hypothetical protein [Chloroflexota bacterium]